MGWALLNGIDDAVSKKGKRSDVRSKNWAYVCLCFSHKSDNVVEFGNKVREGFLQF